MRAKDIKKASGYLARIMKDPFSKQSKAALKRYIGEVRMLIYEKFRGLDFTMVYQCEENGHNNNYSKSPGRVLDRIFQGIDFGEKHSFMDLGCGKGYVMLKASEYPFERVGGVEYTKGLCEICQKNMVICGLKDIEIYNCGAEQFGGYGDYDIFYFGNPFDEVILSAVAGQIKQTHEGKRCTLYYLNPHQQERQKAIVDAGFRLVKVMRDENESYFDVNVYEN